jgi:hypothetical protein
MRIFLFFLGVFLMGTPVLSSHQDPDVELGEELPAPAQWHRQIPTTGVPSVIEDDSCVHPVMKSLGGNFVCGATYTCASLLGAGGGIVYLYIKYPAFVVNTLLGQLAPPILIGGAICGVAGCGLGYYLKTRTDRQQ